MVEMEKEERRSVGDDGEGEKVSECYHVTVQSTGRTAG